MRSSSVNFVGIDDEGVAVLARSEGITESYDGREIEYCGGSCVCHVS